MKKTRIRTKENKHVKERTIDQAMKLAENRKKICAERGLTIKQASLQLKVPRKTIDDYAMQIRIGKQSNFPFENSKDKGMGVLRKSNKHFITTQKKMQ